MYVCMYVYFLYQAVDNLIDFPLERFPMRPALLIDYSVHIIYLLNIIKIW